MQVTVRTKKLKKGRESIYLDITHEAKRDKEYLKLYLKKGSPENKEIKELAEKIRSKRFIELSNQVYGQVSTQKKKASFKKYFEDYNKKKHKWSGHNGAFKHFLRFINDKDIRFKEIDKKWLDSFSKFLSTESELKPSSAFVYFRIVKGVLYEASENGFIRAETIRSAKKLPRKKTKREFLELFEIEKLAKSEFKDSEIKRAFLFSCLTGLRQSDIRNLKWGDIYEGNRIKIKMQKVKEPLSIKLKPEALSLINDGNVYHLPDVKVFKLPIDRSTINRHLVKWFKDVGIKKKAFYHLSRHTFATLGITSGIDIYTLSKLLGHSNIKTTEIYANLIDKKRDDAMDRLPVIELNL